MTCAAVAIDPRPLVRTGLAALADECLDGRVCAAATIDDAAAFAGPPTRALILGLPGEAKPVELVARAREQLGDAPVICALFCDDANVISDALGAPADGYLVIDLADSTSLRDMLDAVARGERIVPLELERCGNRRRQTTSVLTDRCIEVLRCLAEGLHDDEIAERLGMATSSVRKHIRAAELRLRARTRTQAVAMATRAGML